jgi:hypothetical protein
LYRPFRPGRSNTKNFDGCHQRRVALAKPWRCILDQFITN